MAHTTLRFKLLESTFGSGLRISVAHVSPYCKDAASRISLPPRGGKGFSPLVGGRQMDHPTFRFTPSEGCLRAIIRISVSHFPPYCRAVQPGAPAGEQRKTRGARSDWRLRIKNARVANSSPGGEGQGEGGREKVSLRFKPSNRPLRGKRRVCVRIFPPIVRTPYQKIPSPHEVGEAGDAPGVAGWGGTTHPPSNLPPQGGKESLRGAKVGLSGDTHRFRRFAPDFRCMSPGCARGAKVERRSG